MIKKRLSCALACACLALVLYGCAGSDGKPAAPALLPAAGVASDIAVVTRGENYTQKAYDGFVAAYVEELCFTVDGTVEEVLVRPGDHVRKGDKLITLNLVSETERAEALREEIAYQKTVNDYQNRLAEIDISILETQKQALLSGGADKNEVELKTLEIEDARQKLRQSMQLQALSLAQSESELARLDEILKNDAIYAPFDGEIARKIEVARASRVKAYDTLVYLADLTRLRISCEYISESAFKSASGGIYALAGDGKYAIEAVPMDMSAYLSAVLVGETVYTDFSVTGPEGWEDRLEAGMYAAVIFVNNFSPDALLIPANAILSDSGGKYVYVVGEKGERIKRDIRVRMTSGSINAQVLEGLDEGERIYVTDK